MWCWDFVKEHLCTSAISHALSFTDLAQLADTFFQRAKPWMANQTKAQEISMGWWRVPVMSKSRSISMLLESCHPLIFPLHFTFIHFKSTDMCLPVDWLWAIFSCSGLVPWQCYGCVNGKIKLFHMQIWTLRTPTFFFKCCISHCPTIYQTIHSNSLCMLQIEVFLIAVEYFCLDGVVLCFGRVLSEESSSWQTAAVHQLSDTVVVYDWSDWSLAWL